MHRLSWPGSKTDRATRRSRKEARRAERKARQREKKGSRRERTYPQRMALRATVGNAHLTTNEVVLWYVVEPFSTSFRPHSDVENQISSAAAALGDLVGHRLYWRVSTRPYPIRRWAEDTYHDAKTHGEPLAGVSDFLDREQRQMHGLSLADKYVYLGVRIAKHRRYPRDPRREIHALTDKAREVTEKVSTYGLDARPASEVDVEWLLRRSVCLGMPVPAVDQSVVGDYDDEDLPELSERAEWTTLPGGRTFEVTGDGPNGQRITRHVAVLTMGRMQPTNVPQKPGGGWMQRTDRLPFPVEWSVRVEILPTDQVVGKLRSQMDKIRDQFEHYVSDHQIDPPESLKRQRSQALAIEDDVSEGLGGTAVRTEGWYRLAVWGDSEEETLRRVAAVKKLYGRSVNWWHNADQLRTAREFIPGEPLANTAARRRMSVTALAAALPAVTAEIGDRIGPFVGPTSGTSKRAVVWHPWLNMEYANASGLTMLSGTLGSGKSMLGGAIVYRTTMLGATWTVLDPSGRLGSLCELPELAASADYVNLLHGRNGELSPYRVVAEPRPEHFDTKEEWQEARQEAAAIRKSLCRDTLRTMLPDATRDNTETESVLGRAIRSVGGAPTASPHLVLNRLRDIADGKVEADLTAKHRVLARDIHDQLSELAETPRGKLIFPAGYENDRKDKRSATHRMVPRLRVYSLAGLKIPTGKQLTAPGDEERMSITLFNLAAWLTQRSIYEGDPNARKGLFIDEGHVLSLFDSGRHLADKSSTDSRKHNNAVILASQNPTHWDLDNLANLVGSVLVGRTSGDVTAPASLKLLGVAEEDSYIKVLNKLSQRAIDRGRKKSQGGRNKPATTKRPRELSLRLDGRIVKVPITQEPDPAERREYVARIGDRVEKILADLQAHPHVYEALMTTPDSTRKAA